MRKFKILGVVVLIVGAGGAFYYRRTATESTSARQAPAQGGGPGFGGFGAFRPPMTVELVPISRADLAERVTIVGNLIGAATVEVVPKASGRLAEVYVKLSDRIARGQRIAKIEDSEILEQVKQAEASFNVAQATVRQREADLKFAQTNLERSRSLFARQLLPQSTMDDADARQQAATAQLDLAGAQFEQAKARLDELRINLANTLITSPVDGFVGKRSLDPGAYVTPNSSFISVVDIHLVRLVADVIEKDLRRITAGTAADVEVDAYPGDTFAGRVARIAPVLDPATRTAQMEVEIPNPDFRLKPGMYARVNFIVEQRQRALVVPSNAVVDLTGKRGVFMAPDGNTAKFQAISTGLENGVLTEITEGLREGDRVITTGAAALRDGDKIVLAREGSGTGRGGNGPAGAERPGAIPEQLRPKESGGGDANQPNRGGRRPPGCGPGESRQGPPAADLARVAKAPRRHNNHPIL